MTNNQENMTQAAVEATKAKVQAMIVVMSESSPRVRSKPASMGPKLGTPIFKQPTMTGDKGKNT